jgi:hypothetical protein
MNDEEYRKLYELHNPRKPETNVILSSGDISDVDGFFALAEYARSGASCVFIMNYPQFLDPSIDAAEPETRNEDGLGFTYGVNEVYVDEISPEYTEWHQQRYRASGGDLRSNIKQSYTDIAFRLCQRIWLETETDAGLKRGDFFFYVGGINTVNPFASDAIKREAEHWFHYVDTASTMLSTTEGSLVDIHGKPHDLSSLLKKYDNVYMDFNGSAAFFNDDFERTLRTFTSKFRSFFVAGGVLSDQNPMTMVSNPFLNRFSGSTMNQLYHPQYTFKLMDFIQSLGVQIFTVSNNTVKPLESKDQIANVLHQRKIASTTCMELVNGYYKDSSPFPPKKLFDLYTTVALTTNISGRHVRAQTKYLYVVKKYGFCVVSGSHSATTAFEEYFRLLEAKVATAGFPKESFQSEHDTIMSHISDGHFNKYLVGDTTIQINPYTFAIQIQSHCPWMAVGRLADLVSSFIEL